MTARCQTGCARLYAWGRADSRPEKPHSADLPIDGVDEVDRVDKVDEVV
jgi:hypothetical protein